MELSRMLNLPPIWIDKEANLNIYSAVNMFEKEYDMYLELFNENYFDVGILIIFKHMKEKYA